VWVVGWLLGGDACWIWTGTRRWGPIDGMDGEWMPASEV
jgi:hypothetical protein